MAIRGLRALNVNLFRELHQEIFMRRFILVALPLVFLLSWGIGCSDTEPDPERRGDVMKQKNIGEKDKKKGILRED